MTARKYLSILVATAVGCGLHAVDAGAVTVRYAAPHGPDAGACTESEPCAFGRAVTLGVAGDEVVLNSGLYDQIKFHHEVVERNVHGRSAGARPVLLLPYGVSLKDGSISGAELRGTGNFNPTLTLKEGADAERIIASTHSSAAGVSAIRTLHLTNTGAPMVRNSAATHTGTGNSVFDARGHAHLRGVTLYTPSSTVTPLYVTTPVADLQVSVKNSILWAPAGSRDIAVQGTSQHEARVHIVYSNFRTKSLTYASFDDEDAPNQTAIPQLVDPADGDFHQLASSPTVNAGPATGDGTTDFDGDQRNVSASTDIGADELTAPPSVITLSPVDVTSTQATIRGIINPNGGFTSYRLQWGATTAYGGDGIFGGLFAPTLGNGTAFQSVTRTLNGLTPNTTYHFRARATNAAGAGNGGDRTFKTLPAPAGPGGGGTGGSNAGQPGDPPAPGANIPVDPTLRLAGLSVTNKRFRLGRTRTALSAAKRRPVPRGTTFRFSLSRAATVTIAVDRALAGRRSRGRCVKATKALRRRARCQRFVRAASLRRRALAGRNRVAFSGRYAVKRKTRTLARGLYRATVVAVDANGRSAPRRVVFRVVAG